jgi:uncharacterized protein
MEQRIMRKVLQIEGMSCTSCEMRIENTLKKLEGVLEAKAIFNSANAYITYDAHIIDLDQIIRAIEKLDYSVKNRPEQPAQMKTKSSSDKMPVNQLVAVGIVLLALYVIIKHTIGFNFIPEVTPSMGYGVLFAVGLLTSLHCIAMCGGINLSQCVSYQTAEGEGGRFARLLPSFLYNSGRVLSYTVIGGIVGALGHAVSFSGMAKGIVAVISGVFMVIMGLNMLNIFPWLRKLNPRLPRVFANRIHNNNGRYGPFYVGLLNGLMPCGPLQAMQIYALGTGSALAGALSMMLFSLGTVPLMFGFGAVSSLLSGKFTHRMLKASAVLVMVLGFVMLGRGFALSGINSVFASVPASVADSSVARIEGDVQVVSNRLLSGRYTPIVVQKGIPVRWTITVEKGDLNGCNNPVTIPKYDMEKKLVIGENIIEFTPEETGDIPYTCWMGMISSTIKVVDDIGSIDSEQIREEGSVLTPAGGMGCPCCGG